jgi:hypothetical protein
LARLRPGTTPPDAERDGVTKDWIAWHRQYDEPDTELSRRLAIVQRRIAEALDRCPPGTIRLLSMCAGGGRDVLPVLAAHQRRADVRARLVELDSDIAADPAAVGGEQRRHRRRGRRGRRRAHRFVRGRRPAHVVLACGVFGNLTDDSIERTIASVPQLCAPGASVVWTRYQRNEQAVPDVLGWFERHGFELLSTSVPDGTNPCVGLHRLIADPHPLEPGGRRADRRPLASPSRGDLELEGLVE